jgi:preprotein translocase subunit SecG
MGFILFVHVSACILLVVTILMQAGKGGGLAESFSSAESMFGTQTNAFMVRASTIFATIFLATSLILAVFGSRGDKSLMANKKLLSTTQALPATPPATDEPTVKVSDPKPMDSPIDAKPGAAPVANAAK